MKTYLKVPYDEKDEAKKNGARWDNDKKLWYIVKGIKTLEKYIIETLEVDYDDRSEVRRELEPKSTISPSQNHLYNKYNEVDDDTMDHTHEPAQGKQSCKGRKGKKRKHTRERKRLHNITVRTKDIDTKQEDSLN
jgi:hypothetical protein